MPDDTDHTLANYLIDGLNINNHSVSGTDLDYTPDTIIRCYRCRVYIGGGEHKRTIEYTSSLGWFKATQGAVRQALQYLGDQDGADGP